MTNALLRDRFGIEAKNNAMASRIIKDALAAKAICPYEESASRKFMKYSGNWGLPLTKDKDIFSFT